MNTNNKNIFDQNLNDRLSSEELPFDNMAWEMMEEKLDKKPTPFSVWKSPRVYVVGVLAVLLFGTLSLYPFQSDDAIGNTYSEVNSSSTIGVEDALVQVEKQNSSEEVLIASTEVQAVETLEKNTEVVNIAPAAYAKVKASPSQYSKSKTRGKEPVVSSVQNAEFYSVTIDAPLVYENTGSIVNSKESLKTNSASSRSSLAVEPKEEIPAPAFSPSLSLLDKDIDNLDYNRNADLGNQEIEIEEKFFRPTYQFNIGFGRGMTQVNFDLVDTESIVPTAITNQETFLSISYSRRLHRNIGFELGVQGSYTERKLAHYFQAGDFMLEQPQYVEVGLSGLEFKYETFANVHLYLPLDDRSELDFQLGYYSRNPFEQAGSTSNGSAVSFPGDPSVTLIRAVTRHNNGPLEGGRIKLGVNYNFLTNRLNNVGIGVSYMHEVISDLEGEYGLIESSDRVAASGVFRVNGSGFKVHLNYGFSYDRNGEKRKFLRNPNRTKSSWYIALRSGDKGYNSPNLESDNSLPFTRPSSEQNESSFLVGHYIKQKWAVESGVEFSVYEFSQREENIQQRIFTIPLALRYDWYQTDKMTAYAKGIFSTDFRLNQPNSLGDGPVEFVVDENRLLLNAGLELGTEYRIYKGFIVGLYGKYNQAFSDLARYRNPIRFGDQYVFQDIDLKNSYLSFGVELKYLFNREAEK